MPNEQFYHKSFFALDSQCDIVLPEMNEREGARIFEIICKEIERLEKLLSFSDPDSELNRINNAGINQWVNVPEELWDVLSLGYDFGQMSNGAFDIAHGALMKVFRKKSSGEKIEEDELQLAQNNRGLNWVVFNFEERQVLFKKEHIEFDLGGMIKGYVLDVLKELLLKNFIQNAIVSLGENTILAMGAHPTGDFWPIAVRHKRKPEETVHMFRATNEAVVTSAMGKSSIMDPEKGSPLSNERTVSVKTASATLADFIATTWMVLPENDRDILSVKFKNTEILEVDYLPSGEYKSKLTIL